VESLATSAICIVFDLSIDMTDSAALGRSAPVVVGETGPKSECRCRKVGLLVDDAKPSLVTGNGCIDLRREATLLLGFMWKDLSDIALRKGSDSVAEKVPSSKGDCGAGDDSREVLRVPGPENDVELDMYEKRDWPRSESSWTWSWEIGVVAMDDVSIDCRWVPY
jgi:hypothetical protein